MAGVIYPKLFTSTLDSFLVIQDQMELIPDYLDCKECSYDNETKDILRKLFTPHVQIVEKVVEKVVEKKSTSGQRGRPRKAVVDVNEVETEIDDLRTELKNLKIEGKALQTKEKIDIIKLRTGLVEKLIQMREKITSIQNISKFMQVTMDILADLVPAENRDEFLSRIQPFADSEN